MAKNYYLTTNAVLALTDPNAILATPLNLLSLAHRYDDAGIDTGQSVDIGLKNIHTIAIKAGDSATDTLLGTSADDVVFWDFLTLSGITVTLSLLDRTGLPNTGPNSVIEHFDLGDGNDVINLTHNAVAGFDSYLAAATILGGNGDDVLWSGAGDDLLYGGAGLDWVDGGAGNDTIYGDTGADSLFGGSGDDTIYVTDAIASLDAGSGADEVRIDLDLPSYVSTALTTGPDDVSDGDDRVFTTGNYASISLSLGGGADLFIGSDNASTGADRDVIDGQSGNDIIATNDGNDVIFGGADNDVLWGGAGSDTIYGGAGDDILYPGSGGDNVAYGGSGADVWYLYRDAGTGNQIYDQFRETGSGDAGEAAQSGLIVAGDFAPAETGGDFIADGTGVRETDHNIMDNSGGDDMVWVHQVSGTLYQLDVVGGSGTVGMTVQFDVRDVPNIVLWDNDSMTGEVQQSYVWDGSQYVYAG